MSARSSIHLPCHSERKRGISPSIFFVVLAVMTLALFSSLAPSAHADDTALAIVPNEIALDHAGEFHGLILEQTANGLFLGDVTAQATFISSDPAVAAIDAH